MDNENKHIHLIGIDSSGLTPEKIRIISSCSHVFCVDRFVGLIRPLIENVPEKKILPIAPVSNTMERIKDICSREDVALLAGGDPLFFGIGRMLCQTFTKESIRIYPAVSSMQEAFARFKIPWDDAVFLSVHGRDLKENIGRMLGAKKIFFLTDGNNTPAQLASFFLQTTGEINADRYDVYVAENLGQEDECLTEGKLFDIAAGKFSDLSVMILFDKGKESTFAFGLQEDEITHSRGLITKNEVRAATLHALRLPKSGVFWDIGAGSGSLSIEAASISPGLAIYSVEIKTEQLDNIQKNRERYLAYTVQPVMGVAPEILLELPDPDRIFVGGSGGRLREILEYSNKRLRPEGILVVNGILEKTCRQAPEILHEFGFEVLISTIQVTRSVYPKQSPVEFNPISIITGRKKSQ